MSWNDFLDIVNNNQRFLISSHLSLDGDAVGSQVAMMWYLHSLGKDVEVYDYDPVPRKFAFIEQTETIRNRQPQKIFDVLVVLDCSNLHRLGWEANAVASLMVNIDHHRDNTRFGAVNIVDNRAAATGEIIFRFFTECKIEFPEFVAEALYAAIMTDTGGFRFSNTNSKILRICATLADNGADCSSIYERVYASHAPQALLLQARIWSTLCYHLDGKVCSMEMPLSLLDELDAFRSPSSIRGG